MFKCFFCKKSLRFEQKNIKNNENLHKTQKKVSKNFAVITKCHNFAAI